MKKKLLSTLLAILALLTLLSLAACEDVEKAGLWENATYRSDETLGEGEKTILVEVKAEEKSVTFTVKTDKETVGAALLEHALISGDEGPYGLYVTHVNGMKAIYEEDKSYWSFYSDGAYMMSGVDTTPVEDGKHYELVYTK